MPSILVLPPGVASLDEAHAAIELWEHYSGKVLDSAQRLTVEVMMAQGAGGRWAAATTGREESRQNGKGDEVEVVELWGLVQRGEAIMHTVHDAVLLASQTQQRMLGVLEGHGDLRRLVKRKWLGTGQQMIEMRNGGVIWYRTRTGGGGRGVDYIARLVVDEAQHAAGEHLAAMTPTLFASPDPQMNVLGTAGIAGRSDWWWGVRVRALGPDPGGFGYVGHTAERPSLDDAGEVVSPPVDVEDRGLWLAANPAIAAGRGQGMAFLEEQLRRLGPAAFAREHLCVWDPQPKDKASGWEVIASADWDRCTDAGYEVTPTAWSLDVSPDGRSAAIACSDRAGVEVVDYRPGTAWVVPRLVDLGARHELGEIALDATGPAGMLLTELDNAGILYRRVTLEEHAAACGELLVEIAAGTLRHIGQEPLNTAAKVALRRMVTDRWLWTRAKSSGDVCPLVAVGLARWWAAARDVSSLSGSLMA